MNDLQKLFLSELKDMYDGEQQLVKALPDIEKHAKSDQLKHAVHEHLEQTKNHVNRLEGVFASLGEKPVRKTCKGLEGIIDEGQMMAKEFKNNSALDAALITASQKVEHYEITSYGTLCTWAKDLGYHEALSLLKQNLSEEKETDQKLTQLAEQHGLNIEATQHDTAKKSDASAKLSKMVSKGP